ncbi:hypothetical protein FN846DRAFT_991047 [Sphaerosporella brunnea]|uniref:RRM domain-containing protein n=1 Tax=Sphaerosporella brunnea TaxID=1250544 RepID=A0A5J5EPB0_9PEZI|nr:hypothetical protein FN846DRAFT_991047 [Sphaerosporella brunnea]
MSLPLRGLQEPANPFDWRVGESYESFLQRYLAREAASTLRTYINDLNVVNAYYGFPSLPLPAQEQLVAQPQQQQQQQPGVKRWELAEAYQAATAAGQAVGEPLLGGSSEAAAEAVEASGLEDLDISGSFTEISTLPGTYSASATVEDTFAGRGHVPQQQHRPNEGQEFLCLVAANRIIVRGVSARTTEEKVRRFFAERHINVVKVELPVSVQTGELLKWLYVDFQNEDAAKAARECLMLAAGLQFFRVVAT